MAIATVTQFEYNHRKAAPYLKEPHLASENVTFSSTTQSSALQAKCAIVRIIVDADAYMKFGTNPTATAGDEKLTADVEYVRWVDEGDDRKIAFVAA